MTAERRHRTVRDRAAVVALALLQILPGRIRNSAELHAQFEDYLRDEFADAKRAVMDEIRLTDE